MTCFKLRDALLQEHCLWPHLFGRYPAFFKIRCCLIFNTFVEELYVHRKRPSLWPLPSNPPRHSSSVPLLLNVIMLCSRIHIQHLETQATWRRRRVIVFDLVRSISRYFAKSNHFPREKNARRGEHVRKVGCLLKGRPHLTWAKKVWSAFLKSAYLFKFSLYTKKVWS